MKTAFQRILKDCTLRYGWHIYHVCHWLIAMIGFLKNWGRFFPKSDSGVRAVMSWDSGDISVCVEGIDTRDSRASSKAKKAPNLFFFLLPPFLLPYDDGLFFSSYSISLFGLSSFMSLDRLHSLRGSGFTISFCMGGNDKIIQGRIG